MPALRFSGTFLSIQSYCSLHVYVRRLFTFSIIQINAAANVHPCHHDLGIYSGSYPCLQAPSMPSSSLAACDHTAARRRRVDKQRLCHATFDLCLAHSSGPALECLPRSLVRATPSAARRTRSSTLSTDSGTLTLVRTTRSGSTSCPTITAKSEKDACSRAASTSTADAAVSASSSGTLLPSMVDVAARATLVVDGIADRGWRDGRSRRGRRSGGRLTPFLASDLGPIVGFLLYDLSTTFRVGILSIHLVLSAAFCSRA